MYNLDKRNYDEAVSKLEEAVRSNPGTLKYKTALVRAKLKASQAHMDAAEMALARQDYSTAAINYQKALQFDPSNQYAKDQLEKVIAEASAKEISERQAAASIDQMKADSRDDMGVPQLDPASNIPIVLKFADTPVKTILEAVSKASGINFLYDDKADVAKRVTVDFAKVDLSQVMDYLMMQSKNFFKVLDPHTLIVIPDTKQKRDEYTDQVIRTFYLSNADAKDVFQLVRSILQARKMAMNQDLNSITIQDSPDVVAICQRIIEDNDKSKGEVAVDVELLEVDSTLLRQLGINITATSFTIGPKTNLTTDATTGAITGIGTGPPVPLNELGRTLSHSLYIYPVPNFVADLLLNTSNAQILAKPQLRVMEGQKAMVHIGDKYPIPTSNTYTPTTTTTSYTPITSYTYQDIGVKIEIEPKVHHNHEITIKLKVDVSAISGSVGGGTANNPAQPIIGTRESHSVIRLEDGETSMMAGLIAKEERTTLNGVPGLSEIPILRRLFGTTKDEGKKTDVVMLLTPHIIRMPNITEKDLRPLWVGTADHPQLKGEANSSWARSPFVGKKDPGAASPAPGAPKAAPEAKGSGAGAVAPVAPGAGGSPPVTTPLDNTAQGTSPSASPMRIMLSPTNLVAKPGEPVILNLVVVGAQEVKGVHLEMQYPAESLKFQGADEGTFFKMGGGASTFAAQETRPGVVAIDLGRVDGASSGSGLAGRIRLTAVTPGQARVSFGSSTATTIAGQSIPVSPMFASVSVQEATGQPVAPEGVTAPPKPAVPGVTPPPAPAAVAPPVQPGVQAAPAVVSPPAEAKPLQPGLIEPPNENPAVPPAASPAVPPTPPPPAETKPAQPEEEADTP
jgi:general secretion pathway protein D